MRKFEYEVLSLKILSLSDYCGSADWAGEAMKPDG